MRAVPRQGREAARHVARNFLALIFCLMVGTAGLPHILMRYYTMPSVKDARSSVGWSLFFIFLLYFTAPRWPCWEVRATTLVGTKIADLPAWTATGPRSRLVAIADMNLDGILQFGEITLGADVVVLATPEIAGLPYVISGLVAAGGLAAALSTADGLLLTISNALSHDLYYKVLNPNASTSRRLTISKILLLVVALCAAYVATQKPANILFLVAAAFSLAAAAFFPALVLGIFWKRANQWGATLGMVAGIGDHLLLHDDHAALAALGASATGSAPPRGGTSADLGRPVRRADRLRGDHHREPAHPPPTGDAGAGRERALPAPRGGHGHPGDLKHGCSKRAPRPVERSTGLFPCPLVGQGRRGAPPGGFPAWLGAQVKIPSLKCRVCGNSWRQAGSDSRPSHPECG